MLLFSIIVYWLSGFRNDGEAFFTWVLWLFLDLLAAESLVVLLASIFPIFVISLALVAFSNGLWSLVSEYYHFAADHLLQDECGGLSGASAGIECLLEVHFPLVSHASRHLFF